VHPCDDVRAQKTDGLDPAGATSPTNHPRETTALAKEMIEGLKEAARSEAGRPYQSWRL